MAKVNVEKREPQTIAYIEHTGAYSEVPFQEYTERLYGWAKENKVRPGFYPLGIYLDSPEQRPPDELRCEIGIPVYGEPSPSGDVKVKEIPAMEVATIKHAAPAADYAKTYEALGMWIEEQGYEWAGPAIETYTKKPEMVEGQLIHYAKIQAPVQKK